MSDYVGRFAPSPSGPLHFGSLVTALFSFIHAKQHQGKWLVRIEDVDIPRSVPGADQRILDALHQHGLDWDGDIIYQSQRDALYERVISQLMTHCYFCTCSRAQIKQMGGAYNGQCKDKNRSGEQAALRFIHNQPQTEFYDLLHGLVRVEDAHGIEDFVIKRKDKLFAYHLAVVCDDIEQNVTHIVRGADLIETTPSQLALYRAMGLSAPAYLHLPVISTAPGQKLSKQNHATAIDSQHASENLVAAINVMGFDIPTMLHTAAPQTIIEWSVANLSLQRIPRVREMIVPID